jgi:hypothetical protein
MSWQLRSLNLFRRAAACASFVLFAAAAMTEASAQSRAQQAAFSDDEVKAAFLYNFGSYVEWPSIGESDDALTIAVLGAPAVADELERFVTGRTIQGRLVRVRRIRSVNDSDGDEVLFIGSDENWRLAQLIDAVAGTPTLIVTDAPDGLADGGMINFQLIERRVRFEISLPRAQEAGLMLSSRLLAAALRVETTRRWMDCESCPGARPPPFYAAVEKARAARV